MPLITFTVGDWSGDGHNMKDKITVECNVGVKKVEEAYELGKKIVGFDLVEDIATDYSDCRIHFKELQKLRECGFSKERMDDEHTEAEAKASAEHFKQYGDHKYHTNWEYWAGALLDAESYCAIYQFIVTLGNPDIKFSKVKKQELTLGGYGLFAR